MHCSQSKGFPIGCPNVSSQISTRLEGLTLWLCFPHRGRGHRIAWWIYWSWEGAPGWIGASLPVSKNYIYFFNLIHTIVYVRLFNPTLVLKIHGYTKQTKSFFSKSMIESFEFRPHPVIGLGNVEYFNGNHELLDSSEKGWASLFNSLVITWLEVPQEIQLTLEGCGEGIRV